MDDQPRHAATSPDDYTLSIEDALALYARAGLPRTPRTIQRYCANGHLDCRRVEIPYGEKYLITPVSVTKHIAYIEETRQTLAGRDEPRPVAPVSQHQIPAPTEPRPAPTSLDQPRQTAAEAEAVSRYVARLEGENTFLREQITVKDVQIKDLTERARETNHLIAGLQKMLMQQGSQQTQGEALELEIEELLRAAFRDDEICEVKKGQRGADITEKVIDRRGRNCGTILWETKNGKWQEAWLAKLRDDQREAKAHIAVLVAANPPADIETFVNRDGVWIVRRRYTSDLASLLRHILIAVYAERANQAGKDEKMEILYGYLISPEFQHRVQAIVEGFTYLLNDVEREKRWFETKWARQEKEIRKIIDSTQGMYGDLQAVTGRSLPTIAALELPDTIGLPHRDAGAVSV